MNRMRLVYERFTSCCGCQLTLLNCEKELSLLAGRVDLVAFPMASSQPDDGGPVTLALIEGSVSTPDQVRRLLELRRRAEWLVAVGACALTGGVNSLGGDESGGLCRNLYGETASCREVFPPQPVRRFIAVDGEIAGCPPEKTDFLLILGALERGGLPAQVTHAVCMECRQKENLCLLLERRQACLGPVTRAGCGALCPSTGVVCEGCRGWAAEANRGEEYRLLLEIGLEEREIRARMARFAGVDHETPDN